MMPKGIFYADLRLANYLYFEVPSNLFWKQQKPLNTLLITEFSSSESQAGTQHPSIRESIVFRSFKNKFASFVGFDSVASFEWS
jgi:hypothetical protein